MKNLYLMSYATVSTYPKSWYLEGRNRESEAWKRIDEKSNQEYLKGSKKTKVFMNNVLSQCTFKIFRLTLTKDTNNDGVTYLALNDVISSISKNKQYLYIKASFMQKLSNNNNPLVKQYIILED